MLPEGLHVRFSMQSDVSFDDVVWPLLDKHAAKLMQSVFFVVTQCNCGW